MPPKYPTGSAPSERVRILIADDYPMLREGVAHTIGNVPGWEVCGEAGNGRELIEKALALRPQVIVLGLHMPELDGLAAVRELKKQLPDAEVVILSGARAETVLQELFEAGAKSFVAKTDDSELLITAIRSAAEHAPFLTPTVAELLFRRGMQEEAEKHAGLATTPLTEREREVIRHIVEGKSSKEIGAALGISNRTAETHRAAIMRKLHASSTAEIVRYALRDGMIEP